MNIELNRRTETVSLLLLRESLVALLEVHRLVHHVLLATLLRTGVAHLSLHTTKAPLSLLRILSSHHHTWLLLHRHHPTLTRTHSSLLEVVGILSHLLHGHSRSALGLHLSHYLGSYLISLSWSSLVDNYNLRLHGHRGIRSLWIVILRISYA